MHVKKNLYRFTFPQKKHDLINDDEINIERSL